MWTGFDERSGQDTPAARKGQPETGGLRPQGTEPDDRGMNVDRTPAPPVPAAVLAEAKTIAVVGFSTDPSKPSHVAPMELVNRGWTVIPVNPNIDEVAGLKAYATLADVPVPIDIVDVFRPSSEAAGIAQQAAAVGAKTLWLQKGISSTEARDVAAAAGMSFIENECAGATAAHFDVHPPA